MADSINTMLDEMVGDINWLIEFGMRHASFDEDRSELIKLKVKYNGT